MIKLSLLAFIIHSALARDTETMNTRTQQGPVVAYHFSCDSNGISQLNASSSLIGDIDGLDSTVCNPVTNGISSTTPLQSNSTVADLRQHFLDGNASGMVLEVWATPITSHDLSKSRPIFTIGGDPYHEDGDEGDCRNVQLYLGIRGDLLEIRYVSSDLDQPCQILFVRQQPIANKTLVQIVVAFSQDKINVYLNGEAIIEESHTHFMTNLTTWDSNSTLQLLSNKFTEHSFIGTLNQVSIYDEALDKDQIALAYSEELLGRQQAITERKPLYLVASTEPVDVIQGYLSLLTIGGMNRSTLEYSVQVEITALPKFGDILSDKGPVADPGERITINGGSEKASLFYQSWSDSYFNSPGSSYSGKDLHLSPEAFEYRLVAVNTDGVLLGWSDSVTQKINVRHVNQPPTLVVSQQATFFNQSGLAEDSPLAFIENVELKDPDQNIDRVRVDIWTFNGTLEIQSHAELADFDSCRTRSSWQCQGKGSVMGNAVGNITFLAEPDDVSFLLSSLIYIGLEWDQEDIIVIRIYDGSGGGCLKENEHKYDSIHDGCYKIFSTISVPAMSQKHIKFDSKDVELPWTFLVCLFIVIFFAFCQIAQPSQKCATCLQIFNVRRRCTPFNSDGIFVGKEESNSPIDEEKNTGNQVKIENKVGAIHIDHDEDNLKIIDVDQESLKVIW